MSEQKLDNKEIYDQNWEAWRNIKIYGPASRYLRFLIFDLLSKIKNQDIKTILDVGCGEGTNTYFLAKYFPNAKVVGIDFSETGINLANKAYKLPNLTFKQDLESEELNNKWDLITSFEVLEHIEVWEPFLDRLVEATNKYLCLSFPTGKMRPYEVNVGHFRNFKKGEVEEYLSSKGISTIDTNYGGWPFYSPIYRDICQLTSPTENQTAKQPTYGWKQKIAANTLYFSFRHLSTKKKLGDKFCGLFSK